MHHPLVTAELARLHRRDLLRYAERRRIAMRRATNRTQPPRTSS